MSDMMRLAASVEWIVLGVLVLYKLNKLNKRLNAMMSELEEDQKGGAE